MGGTLLQDAALEVSIVGGESIKIKVKRVNVWPYFQQALRSAAWVDQTDPPKRTA